MEVRIRREDRTVWRMEAVTDPGCRIRSHSGGRERLAVHVVHGDQHPRSTRGFHVQATHGRNAAGPENIHPPGARPGRRNIHEEDALRTARGRLPRRSVSMELRSHQGMQGSERRIHEVRKRGGCKENPEADPGSREDRPGRAGRDPGSSQRGAGKPAAARRMDLFR